MIPSKVNSSRLTKILIGSVINFSVIVKTLCGKVADKTENTTAMDKFKRTMQDWCTIVETYSGLLSFIPTEDKYVKLATGVLTTIVQVSQCCYQKSKI